MKRLRLLILILSLASPVVFGQSENIEQVETEKGKLEIWFRLTSAPMTEREIYYHVCRLYINDKEMAESPAVNRESKWVKIFSVELEEGVYEIKILHGYASKEGKWAGEFPRQPKVFHVGIKSGPETVVKYSYNVGLISDNYVYDKLPPVPKAMPKVRAGYKPRILVVIPEQYLRRQRVPDPAAETEIIRKFAESDFYVVDQSQVMEIRYNDESKRASQGDNTAAMAIGRQFDAEVLIIGEAFSQSTGFIAPGSVECNARVEARAIRVDTGQILAAHGLTAIAVDTTEEIASKQALAQAGGRIGDYMVQEIIRRWNSKAVPSVRVKLVNVDFKQLVLFEQALNEQIKDIKGFHRRNFDIVGRIAEIDVDIEGGSQALSTMLTSREFTEFDLEILNFSSSALDLRLKPKDTAPTGLVLAPKVLIFMEIADPGGEVKKCKVMVLNLNETSLEYNWAVEYSNGSTRSGVYKVEAFDKSHDYGVDWEQAPEEALEGTAPWVSREIFRELRDNGFTNITIDKKARKDAIVIAELKGLTTFPVDINGKKQNLKAIQVYTDKGDKLMILDEIQNPLVLSAEVAGIYNSKVTAIYIPGYR